MKSPNTISYAADAHDFCYAVEDRSFWFHHRNRVITALVNRFPPAGPILDVGAGNGFVSLALQRAGWDTVAIEPGVTGAAHARARGVERVVCSTLEHSGVELESAGAVGLFDVLEHVEDDVGFLRSLRPFLHDRGLLYLTVPAHQRLWSIEDVDAGHFRRYSRSRLEGVCRSAGFAVEYSSYFFSLLLIPLLMLRVLPERVGLVVSEGGRRSAHQHELGGRVLRRLAEGILAPETAAVRQAGRIPFGASCVVAARIMDPVAPRPEP